LNESAVLRAGCVAASPLGHNRVVIEMLEPAARARGQSYRERPPAAALAPHLTCAWVQRVAPDNGPYEHHTIPNASVELSCELGSLPRVIGPQSGPLVQFNAPGSIAVGVRIRPGAASSVLGLPASELLDLTVGLEELWGETAHRLGEEMAAAGSPGAAASLLERAALDQVRGADRLDPLVTGAVELLLPGRSTEVASLSSSLYISQRQLRRRLLAEVGFGPKVVHRILRFQGFLALAHARGLAAADVGGLAADSGYADQPHLTRESLRLSGKPPRALLDDADRNCRGLHDHTPSFVPLLRPHHLAA
jgi:AraC-like DNA-binding protein